MKYTTLPYDDSLTHGPVRIIVDKESDIKDLPKDFSAGSKAIVAESGRTYLLNNKQEWKKQPVSSGNNSGGGASEEDIEQIVENILETKDYATEDYVDEAVPDVSSFYTKPQSGIPAADLASGVVPDLSAYAKKNNPVLTGNLSLGTSVTSDGGFGAVGTGLYVKATGRSAHAEGQSSVASGWTAHAEGLQTKASGDYAHAEGYGSSMGNVAVGNVTYIVGASGSAGHSEGENTIAAGNASHAEGQGTVAIGAFTHVGGTYNVIDSDFSDFTEWVSGTSYSVGDVVKVTTANSIKVYSCLTANSDETFTDNKWNQNYIKMQYAEIIGNGADNSHRSNARSLDWEGNEVLAGGLTVNSNSGITIGNTTLTEQNLALLLNNNLLIEARENNGQVTLNKTFNEIAVVFNNGGACRILSQMNEATTIFSVSDIILMDNIYFVGCVSAMNNGPLMFGTDSLNGYPVLNYSPTNSNIQILLSNPRNDNEWTWTANDENFSVTDYISTYSQNRNGPGFYVTIGSNEPILATVAWENENFDSDVLVLSVGSSTFILQDTDHIAISVMTGK